MSITKEWRWIVGLLAGFAACFYLPVEAILGSARIQNAVAESLYLVRWYAREHVILCLVPAFFIAGAISVFVSQSSVMKHLGADANKVVAYGVASVSGSILAVCSCTVLPLFGGIYRMGAGLGPAIAFLYSGPAINVLAIVLTARVLGLELGVARTVGAVAFSVIIGLAMHFLYRKEESKRIVALPVIHQDDEHRPLTKTALLFASMVGILVFANWARADGDPSLWNLIYTQKWLITSILAVFMGWMSIAWMNVSRHWILATGAIAIAMAAFRVFEPVVIFGAVTVGFAIALGRSHGEGQRWLSASWEFAKQITPLLLGGVLIAGALLGRQGHEGLIPSAWVVQAVGGNSLAANFFTAVIGAFMYFATLTEIPILQGLIGSGMGKGPALTLLLAGSALSLPSMLVIRSLIGTQKTIAYVSLVIIFSTLVGYVFGFVYQ